MAGEGWWKRTDEIYEPVRIGEGLAATGKLGAEPMERRWRRSTSSPSSPEPAGSPMAPSTLSRERDSRRRECRELLARARERSVADPRSQPRGRGALRLPRGGQLDDVSDGCVLDLGEDRCSSCGSPAPRPRVRLMAGWHVRMSERFLPPNGPAKRRQLEELRGHVAAQLQDVDWLRTPADPRAHVAWSHRRDGAQPRGRRPARRRAAVQRRAGHGDRSGRARGARATARRPAAESARASRHQAARADLILAGPSWCRERSTRARSTGWRPPRRGCARESSSSACWPGVSHHCLRRSAPQAF